MLEALIDKFTRHLTVTNAVDEEAFTLVTKIAYEGKTLFSHSMDLQPLYDIFRERLENAPLDWDEANKVLSDIG